MTHPAKTRSMLIGLLSVVSTAALAQQPPDPVQSDSLANTAMGTNALLNVDLAEAGCHNTATGEDALYSDTSGSYNTATGFSALYTTTTGANNTAIGYESLYADSTGSDNTASGYQALLSNTTGANNTAFGSGSLQGNSTGNSNNAVGYQALHANTTGYNNNAQGASALAANTTGYGNSAMGSNSLIYVTTGARNVGVGNNTGTSLVAGNYNVDIGWGVTGSGDETGVIRIGNPGYATATYVAGVYGVGAGGNTVCVTGSGQLSSGGTCGTASSRRYKQDIAPLARESEGLMQLEPVSFRYRKADASGNQPLEYGLIAEDVAKVYPELVVYDEQGRPDAVKYQELTPLLLREVQQQRESLAAADRKLDEQGQQLGQMQSLRQDLASQAVELQTVKEQLAVVVEQTRQLLAAKAGGGASEAQLAMR